MIAKLARLEFELFTKPSNSGFLRAHQFDELRQSRSDIFYPLS
jgi:hypothetical protein